jgi:preprotein translocase YajC subunit
MVFLAFLQQTQPNALMGLLPMVLIFAIFYLLLFMPMQKQKKQQRQMLEALQSGTEREFVSFVVVEVRRFAAIRSHHHSREREAGKRFQAVGERVEPEG